jgi:hypothetical protein
MIRAGDELARNADHRQQNTAGFPYASVIRVRFSGYDLSLLLQAPPTMGVIRLCGEDKGFPVDLQQKQDTVARCRIPGSNIQSSTWNIPINP